MYLLDTNILLELLLDQDKASEVKALLKTKPGDQLYLSEFTLFSLGIVLIRKKLLDISKPNNRHRRRGADALAGDVFLIRYRIWDSGYSKKGGRVAAFFIVGVVPDADC